VRRKPTAGALAATAALAALAAGASAKPWPGSAATHPGKGPSHLTVARNTRVLPLNLLVAQRDDWLISISPRGQVVWRVRQADPTQVFVSPTGRTLVIAEQHRSLIAMRRVDSDAVSYRYGKLDAPASALETAGGDVVIADTGSCTVVFVAPGSSHALRTLGRPGVCAHRPPATFSDPDAAFPTPGGGLVVTERRPAWVDVLSAAGRLTRAIALRKGSAPSDASAYGAAGLIVANRSDPGRIEEIDETSGAVTWSYGPLSGPGRLDDPAEAEVLPDGDVLVVDSGNDRVIVIDARTKTIVWQYGHTARARKQPGYLDDPGSATLVPIGP
jgi:hypothetical protein